VIKTTLKTRRWEGSRDPGKSWERPGYCIKDSKAVDFTLMIDGAGERFLPPEPAAVVIAGTRLL
jgi:hypothetical protein